MYYIPIEIKNIIIDYISGDISYWKKKFNIVILELNKIKIEKIHLNTYFKFNNKLSNLKKHLLKIKNIKDAKITYSLFNIFITINMFRNENKEILYDKTNKLQTINLIFHLLNINSNISQPILINNILSIECFIDTSIFILDEE